MAPSANNLPAAPTDPAWPSFEPVTTPQLALCEVLPAGLVRLSTRDTGAARARLAGAGIALPEHVGERLGNDPAALCLGPGEWLLVSASRSADELVRATAPALDGLVASCLDVSDGHRVVRVAGPAAPWLLSKLCALDFLAGIDEAAHATRTRLADIPVVVGYDPAKPGGAAYELVVDRSLARYLWARLIDALPHAEELYRAHGVHA